MVEPKAYRDQLTAALRACADPERAVWDKRYHKSDWEHWGVTAPEMEAAIRASVQGAAPQALLSVAGEFWQAPVWDLKIAALRMLARKSLPADERLWSFVLARMSDLDAWAVADCMASVASRCLLDDPARLDIVEPWVESQHLWTRRASLVFTLPWTRTGRDPERMLAWAAGLSGDPEWFIQKAIGWWLRELSKRDPERVREFLTAHGERLKGFARREASKYL